jgi:hypothetical protein
MKRLTKWWFLKEKQLGPNFDYYCLQRLSPTLDDSHMIEYKEKPLEPIAMLLIFDKVVGCMSSLTDAAAELMSQQLRDKSSEDSRDCHTHWLGAWICLLSKCHEKVEATGPTSFQIGAQWQSDSCLYLGVQRNV